MKAAVMGFVLKLTMIGLGISIIIVASALALGQIIQTDAITDYHTYESQTYTLSVRDLNRGIRMPLAGTRCFKSRPPWAEEQNTVEDANLYTGQYDQIRDDEPQRAITRLKCR